MVYELVVIFLTGNTEKEQVYGFQLYFYNSNDLIQVKLEYDEVTQRKVHHIRENSIKLDGLGDLNSN